tara:strand:- start:8679 stop:9314 length:636 start_codon:yes stop_codon:yes gene_type:complete
MEAKALFATSLLAYAITGILSVFVAENVPDMSYRRQTLYDVIHNSTPHVPRGEVPTFLVSLSMVYVLARWATVDLRILAVYFFALSAMLFVRLFTFTLTQTPPPRRFDANGSKHLCKRTMFTHFGISFSNEDDSCLDNMFSGHAATVVAGVTTLLLFSNNRLEKIIGSVVAVATSIMVITSRLHYTSDVIVGAAFSFMAVCLFKNLVFAKK